MAIDIFNNTQVAIEAYRNFFMELTRDLCISSIIIYKQPPAIVTMFEQRAASTKSKDKPNKNDGELKKSIRPRSRFWFDTEIRYIFWKLLEKNGIYFQFYQKFSWKNNSVIVFPA
jgi:hypothetical protein